MDTKDRIDLAIKIGWQRNKIQKNKRKVQLSLDNEKTLEREKKRYQ